jgi:hypothetical protein
VAAYKKKRDRQTDRGGREGRFLYFLVLSFIQVIFLFADKYSLALQFAISLCK